MLVEESFKLLPQSEAQSRAQLLPLKESKLSLEEIPLAVNLASSRSEEAATDQFDKGSVGGSHKDPASSQIILGYLQGKNGSHAESLRKTRKPETN
jgi:hypothetical protein